MRYELTARQVPALFTLLPVALALATVGAEHWKAVQSLFTLAVGLGAQVVLAKFARYMGQHKQEWLWKKWGGNPTALCLRHSDDTLVGPTKKRYRQHLERMLGSKLPSEEEERDDSISAMQTYEGAVDYLRSVTRSEKDYPLVLTENINYGLARNLYGLRPFGIGLCLASLGAIFWKALPQLPCGGEAGTTPLVLVAGGVILVILAGWITFVHEKWVRRCSDGYARALLETTERLTTAQK